MFCGWETKLLRIRVELKALFPPFIWSRQKQVSRNVGNAWFAMRNCARTPGETRRRRRSHTWIVASQRRKKKNGFLLEIASKLVTGQIGRSKKKTWRIRATLKTQCLRSSDPIRGSQQHIPIEYLSSSWSKNRLSRWCLKWCESTLLRRFAQTGPSGSFGGFNANLGVFEKLALWRVVFAIDHTLCKTLVNLFTFSFLKIDSLSSRSNFRASRVSENFFCGEKNYVRHEHPLFQV